MIEREMIGETTVLRLAHGRANTLDLEFCGALREAVEETARDATRALLLTGAKPGAGARSLAGGESHETTATRPGIFSAGVDLRRLAGEGASYVRPFLQALSEMLISLLAFPKPMVVAINGHAIAGGMVIAAAADCRIMARGAGRLGVPELAVGVPFPPAALHLLRLALSPADWSRFILCGALIGPEEAERIGFLHGTEEPERLEERCLREAERLGAINPRAFALTKRQLRAELLARLEDDRGRWDREIEATWASSDTLAAVQAYVERTLGR